jgi:leucyl aminopeptidase
MWTDVKIIDKKIPISELGDDELLVVISSDLDESSKEIFERAAYPNLTQQMNYLRVLSGFLEERGKKPFVYFSWESNERPLLEKRWLISRYFRRMRSVWNVSNLVILLASQSTFQQDLAFAEDLYMMHRSSSPILPGDTSVHAFKNATLWVTSELSKSHRNGLKHKLAYMDWVNENPDDLTSLEMGQRLKAFADDHSCSYEELDEKRLAEQGLNLLLAVGQASLKSPSRLFILSKNCDGTTAPLMLVGKGITFDTGGINVKPFESHVGAMKNDMGGAALMSQLFMALVSSGYTKPLVLVVPACENLVDANSMKPGTVIKSHHGEKVLIEHTDAEGRLILADAISYAQKAYKPELTLVAATLTTAALRQYTNFITPCYFADKNLQARIEAAAKRVGERFLFWDDFLPFESANRAKFGDLTNMGRMPGHASIGGGSNVAAHFLRRFADYPLVHFDIFASAWNWSGDYPGGTSGATGAPFHSLFHALLDGK